MIGFVVRDDQGGQKGCARVNRSATEVLFMTVLM
jgi:hypothetical protein